MEKPTEKPHDVVEEDQKELDDWLSKLEHHKSLEEQEQRTIAELTNQLAECVSEVEEHECSMDTLQKQLASLQTQLEVSARFWCVYLWFLCVHLFITLFDLDVCRVVPGK